MGGWGVGAILVRTPHANHVPQHVAVHDTHGYTGFSSKSSSVIRPGHVGAAVMNECT